MSRSLISLIALGLCLCLAAARPTYLPSHSLDLLLELHEAKAALAYSELQLVRHQALTKEVQLKLAAQGPPQPRPTQNTHAPAHTTKPQVSNQKMTAGPTAGSASHDSTRSSDSSICDSIFHFGMFLLFFKLVGKMFSVLVRPTSCRSAHQCASNNQCASSQRPFCGAWKVGRGLFGIVTTIASVYYFSHVLLLLLSVGAVLTSLFISAIPTILMVLMLAVPISLVWRYMNSQPRSMVWEIVQPVASTDGPLLQRGDRGAGVAQLQNQLIQLGYMEPNAIRYGAGIFGPFTQEAVCRVQRRMGIQPTGHYDSTIKDSLQKQLTQMSKGAVIQAGHGNTTDQTHIAQKQAQDSPSNVRQGMCCVKPMHRARRGSATQMTIRPDAQQAMLVHAAQNEVHMALARAAAKQVTQLAPNSHPVPNQESPRWKGIWCDACKVSPIVGARFTKQLQHDTYDLCQGCFMKQSTADQASFTEAVHVQAKKQNKQRVSTQPTTSQQTRTKQVSETQVIRAHRYGEAYPLTGSGNAAKNVPELIAELNRVKPVTSIFPVEWRPMVRDLQEMGFAQEASQVMVMETKGSLREAVKRLVAAERLS